MALNSLPLDWGHQRSLCVLLSIYFTHHPSSGRGDPTTLQLGLPVSWLSIHEHGAWRSVNICSVRKEEERKEELRENKTRNIWRQPCLWFWTKFVKIQDLLVSSLEFRRRGALTFSTVPPACVIVPVYPEEHGKQMPAWTPIEGYLQKKTIPRVCCQLSIRVP